MLILGRRVDEEILIPEFNIRIKVFKIDKHEVKLGFEAPREINIVRSEIFNPEHKQNKETKETEQ